MNTNSLSKICVNCQKEFSISSEDFSFYQKIKVPPPTWCFKCQFIRRMVFRNENKLYFRTNNAPNSDGKKLVSLYSEDKEVKVFDHKSWWGDEWDAYSYAKDVDFSRPFLEQVKELIKEVPCPNLMNWNAVNSDYCNCTAENKNCYFVFGGDFNENCSYSTFNFHSRDSQDMYFVDKCELCYENVDVEDCYRVSFSQLSKSCADSMFLFDCINCTNCIGCVGLRNKSNCILNKQYSREEFLKLSAELNLNSRKGLESFRKIFIDFSLKFPRKYAHIVKSLNCTGDNIVGAKNCLECFDVNGGEDLKNAYIIGFGEKNLADSRSISHGGHGSELVYDSFGVFSGSRNVKFSIYQPSSIDVSYSYNCPSSSNIFGCVGVQKGNYSILNKKYTKEEYEKLIPKIIEHMDTMPYIDKKGRVYKYGEFFPSELSPFAYNETIAFDHQPLTKEEAINLGYTWKDPEEKNYKSTIDEIPDTINEVDDDILNQTLPCAHAGNCNDQCTKAFKIIQSELQLYRRLNLPLPKFCPNCRHYARLRSRNPWELWSRVCMCDKDNHGHVGKCDTAFETTYDPKRPEIVYCEKCYQQEIY